MSSAGTIGFPVSLGQMVGDALGVPLGHVDAGADGRRTHVDGVEGLFRLPQVLNLAFKRGRERVELLSDGHRDGVLHLGAAHLHDFEVRVRLLAK